MSADGKKLAFLSLRSGHTDIWMKDLESGKEKQRTGSADEEGVPKISSDGNLVIYAMSNRAEKTDLLNSSSDIYLIPAKGGMLQTVCRDAPGTFLM